MAVSAVDLFCGVGGLTNGLVQEGINVVGGFDLDPVCEFPFEHNNQSKFYPRDITSLSAAEVSKLYPKGQLKLLAGCAPCQPFSNYTNGRSKKGDGKWDLLYSFSRLVKEVEPDLVTMENVENLPKHKVYDDFVSELKELGYHVTTFKVFCPDYGIPQTRTRLVLFASKFGPVPLIPPTHSKDKYKTVKEAIGHMESIVCGSSSINDPLHSSSRLSELNYKRIKASRPGGTWRDWDDELVADCHKKPSGKSYPGVYARMEWDKPSPTMTTQFYGFGNGRFGHPEQDRALSLREGAILQTFPDNYQFTEPGQPIFSKTIGRLIGNAVPVDLGRVVARSILEHINEHKVKQ